MAAMLTVLNKRWISQGWRAMDKADSEPMALVFIEALNRENVPYQYYGELFQRSIALRSSRLAAGLKCEDFSVDLMLACWPVLREELHQREIDAGRTLPSTAQSQCERCLGSESGMERIYDENGDYLGVKKGCDHRPIVEGEGIWIHLQKLKAAARSTFAANLKSCSGLSDRDQRTRQILR